MRNQHYSNSLFELTDLFYKFESCSCINITFINKELNKLHSRKNLTLINQLEEYFIKYFPRFWISNVLSPRYYDAYWRNSIFTLSERLLLLKCLFIKKYYYKLDLKTIKFYNSTIKHVMQHQKLQTGQIKDKKTGEYKKIKVKSAFNIFKINIDKEDAIQ